MIVGNANVGSTSQFLGDTVRENGSDRSVDRPCRREHERKEDPDDRGSDHCGKEEDRPERSRRRNVLVQEDSQRERDERPQRNPE